MDTNDLIFLGVISVIGLILWGIVLRLTRKDKKKGFNLNDTNDNTNSSIVVSSITNNPVTNKLENDSNKSADLDVNKDSFNYSDTTLNVFEKTTNTSKRTYQSAEDLEIAMAEAKAVESAKKAMAEKKAKQQNNNKIDLGELRKTRERLRKFNQENNL